MIIKKSLPYALLILLMMMYNRIDTVLIERLLPGDTGSQQAGVYAQAYRLLDATNMIAFLFAVLLLPIFAKMLKTKEPVEKMVRLSFSILFTISVIVAFSSYFYSSEIMHWLYPIHDFESASEYSVRMEQSAKAFSLLMFAFVAISTSYVFGTLLTANGSLKQLNIIAGAGVVVSFTVNYLLIPKLLSVGSAYASLSAQFLNAGAQVVVARILFKFKPDKKFVSVLIIFVIGVLLAGYYSRFLPYDWKANLVIMILISGVLSIVLRLMHIKEFIRIIKDEKEPDK
jgi:O-antigen/teichoic acid export membrane protein